MESYHWYAVILVVFYTFALGPFCMSNTLGYKKSVVVSFSIILAIGLCVFAFVEITWHVLSS